MRKLLIIVIAIVFAHTAWSGDLEDGLAAYERKDYATAITKFRSAAQQGIAEAHHNIGIMYVLGQGVAQDYSEAVRWYQLAAQQGFTEAQRDLGAMYWHGKGVAQDNVKAYMWTNISAVNGKQGEIEYRDLMASKMTPQQIEQAQRMARECLTSNFTKCD